MKILLASKDCLIGGIEAFMVSLATTLQNRGYQCELFFFQHGPKEQHLPANCVAHFGSLADLLKLVRDEGFDIVHAGTSDWETGISAVRSVGARLVITSHHNWIVPAWNSTTCDALVGCSRWLTDLQQPVTDLPVQAVLNGIDTKRFHPPSERTKTDSPVVAWVGRGTSLAHKRIDKFAAIAPALHRAGARVWLAEPYGADKVEKVAAQAAQTLRPLAERWSAVPSEQMPRFFQDVAASGGCVISTSSWEGLPLTLIEAQACGCPVIGADVPGVNECVNPQHGGVLYPFDASSEELTALVLGVLRDKAELRRNGLECAQYAQQQFSLERMADDYVRLYRLLPHTRRKNLAGAQARWRLAPLVKWSSYIDHRWSVGQRQFDASQELADRGEWELAERVARTSLRTAPTIYLRPERLADIIRTRLRARRAPERHLEGGQHETG